MTTSGTCIRLALLLISLGAPIVSGGQLTFEVASIRQNSTLAAGGGGGPGPAAAT